MVRICQTRSLITALCVAGCSQGDKPPGEIEYRGPDVEMAFLDAETRLMRSPSTQIDFTVTAEGAISASIEGVLYLENRHRGRLQATGTFAGEPVDLRLISDGARMVGGAVGQTFDIDAPPRLRESFVIGLARMGILHNLARLSSGQPPDHADGTVKEWLGLSNFVSRQAPNAQASVLWPATFDLAVGGVQSAVATVWIDRSGLPKRREQTVQFEDGEMRVVEEYTVTEREIDEDPELYRVVAPQDLHR
jgi:hypothetical protein